MYALRICISVSFAPCLRHSLSLPLPNETTYLCDNLLEATDTGGEPDIGDVTSSQKGLDGSITADAAHPDLTRYDLLNPSAYSVLGSATAMH